MNRFSILMLAAIAAFPAAVGAQTAVTPEYGTLTAGGGSIVFTNDGVPGDFVQLDAAGGGVSIVNDPALENAGAIGYLEGSNWLFGMTSDAPTGPGDVFVLDAGTGTLGPPIANLTDVRDLAVIDQGTRFDAIVADRANDTVHLITDVLGSPSVGGITPSSIAGNVGIQGVAALSDTLYFLYDELPEGGFGADELIVVEGNTPDAETTRISWNEIGSAGAGLNPDELSVDFHNGLAVRQPDDSTITMYLSNFGAFSGNQIIEVTWTDSGSGFDFSAPVSSVLLTETGLWNAIAENNGDAPDPLELANSRGVAILPGATPAEDRLAIWVDDSGNNDTYILIYGLSDGSFSLLGGAALETVLDETAAGGWRLHR